MGWALSIPPIVPRKRPDWIILWVDPTQVYDHTHCSAIVTRLCPSPTQHFDQSKKYSAIFAPLLPHAQKPLLRLARILNTLPAGSIFFLAANHNRRVICLEFQSPTITQSTDVTCRLLSLALSHPALPAARSPHHARVAKVDEPFRKAATSLTVPLQFASYDILGDHNF